MKTCAYCGRPMKENKGVDDLISFIHLCCDKCFLAWMDEYDQARWAEESSSIKSGVVGDPADDETPD